MTVVITYLAKDNAKTRYRARRAAKREQMEADARLARKIAVAGTGCSLKVSRAINSPSLRERKQLEINLVKTKYQKVSNEACRQIHAVQKFRGKSTSLI